MILLVDSTSEIVGTAKAISDLGFMAVATAVMLIGIFLLFRYFLKMFKDLVEKQNNRFVYESPMEQIRVLQSVLFDLSKYEVLEHLNRIFDENNLHDTESVKIKVQDVLTNIHRDRNSKLDNFRYHGYRLSYFTSTSWIERIEGVCMKSLYLDKEHFNERQAFSSLDIAYNYMKIEFYNNIISKS